MVHNNAVIFLWSNPGSCSDKLTFKRMLVLLCIFMWEVPSPNFSHVNNYSILKIAQNKSRGSDFNAVYFIRKIIVVFSL